MKATATTKTLFLACLSIIIFSCKNAHDPDGTDGTKIADSSYIDADHGKSALRDSTALDGKTPAGSISGEGTPQSDHTESPIGTDIEQKEAGK